MITEMYLFASGFVGTVYAAAEKNTGLVFPLKREVPVSGCLHVISPIYFSGQKTIVVVVELLESRNETSAPHDNAQSRSCEWHCC